MERSARRYSQAYRAFLAGADPASSTLGPVREATSALQRRLWLIEDLATKGVGNGTGADGARMRLIELDGDVRFARTLAAQGRLARTQTWPKLIIDRLSEAAKLARSRKSERVEESPSSTQRI